jgi:hypothetical protein
MDSKKNYQATSHKIQVLWYSVVELWSEITEIKSSLDRIYQLIDKLWRRIGDVDRPTTYGGVDGVDENLETCFLQAEMINSSVVVTPLGPNQWHVVASCDVKISNVGAYGTSNSKKPSEDTSPGSFITLYNTNNGAWISEVLSLAAGQSYIIEEVVNFDGNVIAADLSTEGENIGIWIDPTSVLTNASVSSKLQHVSNFTLWFA